MTLYTKQEDDEIWEYIRNYTDDEPTTDTGMAFFEEFKRVTGSTRPAFGLVIRFKTTLSPQLHWKFDEPTRKRLAERFNLAYSGSETRRFSRRLQSDGTPARRGRRPSRPSRGPIQQVADENDDDNADIVNLFSPRRDEEVVPDEAENQENIADPEDPRDPSEASVQEIVDNFSPAANVAPTDESRESSVVEIPVESNPPEDNGLGILMNGLETVVGAIGDEQMKARFQAINARYQAEQIFSIDELKRVADGAMRMFD